MKTIIKLPENVSAKINDYELIVEGPKGATSKVMKSSMAGINVSNGEIIIESKKDNRRAKRIVNTFRAHARNLIKGVLEGYEAELVIRYGHFPMNVKVDGKKVIVENFVGEKVPRKTKIVGDCTVSVNGDRIKVSGINKEHVGQTAANIELMTRIRNKDYRIFQDGIWIVKKPGRKGL